ncbi:MAG: hypothetical protein IJ268_12175, partial [Proteobacteria bacterium]|nr:hypothetical protein [Pseudomonadota bacterium]
MTKTRSISLISCLLAAASICGCENEDPKPAPQPQLTCGSQVCASNEVCILSLSTCTIESNCDNLCGANMKCA